MTLKKCLDKMKFDTRMVEYNFRSGAISEEDYKNYLAQLPDSTGHQEPLSLEGESGAEDSGDVFGSEENYQ